MADSPRIVVAGWYEDPHDPDAVRWWNGIAWTDHTRERPERGAAAHAAPADDAASAVLSAAPPPREEHAFTTTSSTLLSFTPLMLVAAALAAGWLWSAGTRSPLVWGLLLVPLALGVLWAVLDARALRAAGRRVPWAWALLGPLVYLVVRAVRARGWSPALICLGLAAAVSAGSAVVWATGFGDAVTFALHVQDAVEEELVAPGTAQGVECPALIENRSVGATHTCAATLPDGSEREVIVSIDTDAGDLSWSLR